MIRRIIVSILIAVCLIAPACAYYDTAELTAAQCSQLTRGNTWTYNINSNILQYLPNIPDNPQLTITYGKVLEDGKISAVEEYQSAKVKNISYYYIDKSGNLLMQRNDYPFEWAFYIFGSDINKKNKKVLVSEKPFIYAVLPSSVILNIEWKQNMYFTIPSGTFAGKKAHISISNKIREMNKIFTNDAGLFPDTMVIDTTKTMTIEGVEQEFQEQGTIWYSPATGMPVKIILAMSVSGYNNYLTWTQELSDYSLRYHP